MAALSPVPKLYFVDSNGNPLVGGKLWTYESGTSTPAITYSNASGSSNNTNPVILDSRGEALVYLNTEQIYRFYLTDANDVPVWPSPIDNVSSGIVELISLGVFASSYSGYDPSGATFSTTAIQAAINAAVANGTRTVIITGKPKINAPLTYTGNISLVGACGGETFTNNFDQYPIRINCNAVNGYTFDQPDVVDGSGGLAISNICFDGRSSGGIFSTTWQGLVKGSTTSGTSSFYLMLDNVMVGNSNSATSILDLSGQVFCEAKNSFFVNWWYGMAAKSQGANILGTTVTFQKCYFSNLRQVGEFYDNMTDVHFNDCVMESCNTGVAALKTNVTFTNLYSENMGYDPSGTGIVSGITPRNFGIAFAPNITGNVTAMFTSCYGQMIFDALTVLNTTGGRKWFDGIGRSSTLGNGGLIKINDISLAAGTINTLFTADADSPTSKANFQYHLTVKPSTAAIVEADARILSNGYVNLIYSDGNYRMTTVTDGLYSLGGSTYNTLASVPTSVYPNGGGWVVGDSISYANSTLVKGKTSKYVCSTAGTTGARFDTVAFVPSSKSQSVAAAGTMTITAQIDNTGDLHVWEVLASTGANINSFYRVSMESFTGAGQLYSEALVTTNTLTFTMSWGAPYTITITNTSGATLSIYARLVSVTSCH
jgi:hypothetical protein